MTSLAPLAFLALPGCLLAQAAAEHAAASAGAATMTGPARSVGKGIAGAFGSVSKTLDRAAQKSSAAPAPTASKTAPPPARPPSSGAPKAVKTYEDPAGIKPGIARAELLRRFGEPSMMVTGSEGDQTLWYPRQDGRGEIPVRLAEGKVVSVGPAE